MKSVRILLLLLIGVDCASANCSGVGHIAIASQSRERSDAQTACSIANTALLDPVPIDNQEFPHLTLA